MKVFFAVPAYDGRVVKACRDSLEATIFMLTEAGVKCHLEEFSGCCYLPIARNKLTQKFLASDCTDMMFIDSDVSWDPEDMVRFLEWPVDIVAGAYRVKEYEERYPLWIKQDESGRPVMAGLSDLIECWGVPTGFMRISRSVFDTMAKHYGTDLEVDEYLPDKSEVSNTYLNFFDTKKIGRQWFGEDILFSRNWTMDMGRKLYVDPIIKLTHWGTWPSGQPRAYDGNYHDFLSRLPNGANDPGYQGSGIEGFLMRKEAQWLYSKAKQMTSIVEIGSYVGKSAHALLSGCPGSVTCVDPWRPLPWHAKDTEKNCGIRFDAFLKNTEGFPGRIVKRTTSLEAASSFQYKSIDMVWIDGDHGHEAVIADINAWLPKCRKLICGHDYEEWGWPGVKQAVDEAFGNKVETYESIWYVEIGG